MSAPRGSVQVHTYKAKNQPAAAAQFTLESSKMAAQGYTPTGQSWASPSYARLVITPVVLIIVGFLFVGLYGLLIGLALGIVYVLAVRPLGSLMVTYERRASSSPAIAAAPTRDHMADLDRLGDLRDRGLITPADYDTKKAEILARI